MSKHLHSIPVETLDKEATLRLLRDPAACEAFMQRRDHWDIKSTWLCEELNRFEAEGPFVYNAQALRRIEKENDLPPSCENGSALSLLIYNAQQYRSIDRILAEGFQALTAELIEQAISEKKLIEVHNLGSLTGNRICRPGHDGAGKPFAFLKGKRKTGYYPSLERGGRLVAKNAQPAEAKHEFIKIVTV